MQGTGYNSFNISFLTRQIGRQNIDVAFTMVLRFKNQS